MDKSRVEPTIFFIEKILFSLKLFSGHFYGQSFIKTVRGPCYFIGIMKDFRFKFLKFRIFEILNFHPREYSRFTFAILSKLLMHLIVKLRSTVVECLT